MGFPYDVIEAYINGKSTVQIGKEYNTPPSTVRNFLIANNVKMRSNKTNSRKYSVCDESFNNIDTEEKAYWLGFLYADGYVSSVNGKRVGLSLASVDRKHIEKFRDFLKSDYPIKTYISSGYSKSEYCRVIVSSDKLYDDLTIHGVYEHKSSILRYPSSLPVSLQRHFMRGYVDGDGCITSNGNSYALKILGTDDFIAGVIEFLTNEQAYTKGTINQRKPECPVKSLDMFGETAYNTMRLLYEDQTVSLDRKLEKATKAISYFSRLYQ